MAMDADEGLAAFGSGAALSAWCRCQLSSALTAGVEDRPNDPEEHAHEGQSDHQRPSSTESLNTEEDEDGGGDNLDDTIDTRGEQRGGSTGDTDRLEDVGGVVVDLWES